MDKNTLLIAMALLAAAAFILFFMSPQKMETTAPLTIAVENWPPEWYFYVASSQGYFNDEGVDVRMLKFEEYPSSFEAFRKNQSIDCLSMPSTDLFKLREDGVHARMIFITDSSQGGDAIAARGDMASFEQLRGKKVGVEGFNTYSHLFTVKMLELYGLSETDVSFMDVPAIEVPDAIRLGKIDAGHVYAPATFQSLSYGQRLLDNSTAFPGLMFDGIACRERTLVNRQKDVQGMVNAWFSAKDYALKNRVAAEAIMARANNVPTEELESGLVGNRLYELGDNLQAFSGYSQGTLVWSLDMANKFLLSHGQASGDVHSSNLLNSAFVFNVNATRKVMR